MMTSDTSRRGNSQIQKSSMRSCGSDHRKKRAGVHRRIWTGRLELIEFAKFHLGFAVAWIGVRTHYFSDPRTPMHRTSGPRPHIPPSQPRGKRNDPRPMPIASASGAFLKNPINIAKTAVFFSLPSSPLISWLSRSRWTDRHFGFSTRLPAPASFAARPWKRSSPATRSPAP